MSSVVGALREPRPAAAAAERIGLIAPAGLLPADLMAPTPVQWYDTVTDCPTPEAWPALFALSSVETLVYVPHLARAPDLRPDLVHARAVLQACRDGGTAHVVLVSSTAVYGATPRHAGLARERRPSGSSGPPIAREWLELEALAASIVVGDHLTILRAAPVPVPGGRDFYSRLLRATVAVTVAGHDPTLQLLSQRDLARAVETAVRRRRAGVFNVVPAAPVPLRAALRAAGCRAVPLPWSAQLAYRALVGGPPRLASPQQLQFLRCHLTASPEKAARELGFVARETSIQAVLAATGRPPRAATEMPFDPFGLDRAYIDACRRGLMGFLHRRYFRVEARGLEHIPRLGGAVLAGMHRGFMPLDGVMTLLTVTEGTGRVPRFLIHPGVGLRFPFLFNLMSKFGGVIACQENGDRVLAGGELLGIYPEGIRGAFTMYRCAHRIGPSWRSDCVGFALRHRVPIVPFVTVGSAEIFPILGRIDWRWWKQYTGWPFIPITPTFPLVPLPLPSKWHTLFLEPLHVEREHPAEAADDPAVVSAIGAELRRRMEAAVADLVSRRKSIFFGSLFDSSRA